MSIPALRVIVAGLEKQREHLEHLIAAGAPTVQDIRDIKAEQQRFLELAAAAIVAVEEIPAPPPPVAGDGWYKARPGELVRFTPAAAADLNVAAAKRAWWKFRK